MKYKIINQIKYGFDIRDCWDLGTSTSNFMLPRLRKLIDDDPMGCPSELTRIEYVHKYNLGKYYPTGSFNSNVNDAYKAWVAILEKIYTSLEYASNRYDDKFDCFYENEYGERELDKHKSILRYDEISEGFRLLGLFFQNLWD